MAWRSYSGRRAAKVLYCCSYYQLIASYYPLIASYCPLIARENGKIKGILTKFLMPRGWQVCVFAAGHVFLRT